MITRWYRTGVFYSVDVGLFQDSNDDGVGDFRGLIARLDYLARLGITTIWLHPIHPSPQRDGGYDITDYFGVHPRLAEMGDFEMLVHEAAELSTDPGRGHGRADPRNLVLGPDEGIILRLG